MVVVKSQNGIRKNILFKSAVDAVVRRYKDKFERQGIANAEERATWLVSSGFASAYVDRDVRGRMQAILFHPIVFARYVKEEVMLMKDPEVARKAEIIKWDLTHTVAERVTEEDTVEAREKAMQHSGELRFHARLTKHSLTVTAAGFVISGGLYATVLSVLGILNENISNAVKFGAGIGLGVGALTVISELVPRFANAIIKGLGKSSHADVQTPE